MTYLSGCGQKTFQAAAIRCGEYSARTCACGNPTQNSVAMITARGAATGEEGPRPQLWLLPAAGGEAWQLTSARDGVSGYAWSPDGSRIAFLTTDSLSREAEAKVRRRDDPKPFEQDFRLRHAWVIDVASKKASKLTSGDFIVTVCTASSGGSCRRTRSCGAPTGSSAP